MGDFGAQQVEILTSREVVVRKHANYNIYRHIWQSHMHANDERNVGTAYIHIHV
jgi:hypothetical protein